MNGQGTYRSVAPDRRAIDEWLQRINNRNPLIVAHSSKLRLPYTVYGCMLLLSQNAFNSDEWRKVRDQCDEDDFVNLFELLAKYHVVTHIAINQPIPLLNDEDQSENVLRAPLDLQPLYGDFGPSTCSSPPTQEDFDSAFWVQPKQNQIVQVYAPRWTMFSRGNISEKTRLLTLPSVVKAVEQGKADARGCAAVDLFAGIGYFAFSYLKAGITQVICWDLNPWSIEGLRRGAAANKWSVTDSDFATHEEERIRARGAKGKRLLIFNESNEHAASRINRLRACLPPIRHVNCGLLPTSSWSWRTAVEVLDPELGGWVHVHENVAVDEIEAKAEKVRLAFRDMLDDDQQVRLDGINRVKSYAPNVMHCVLDIYICPIE